MKIALVNDVIIVGGGIAGLSAAIYLGRAMRRVLVVDSQKSLAVWERDVENYLGFPDGISGQELLQRGRRQARLYKVRFNEDEIVGVHKQRGVFLLTGQKSKYCGRRVLLATGLYHLPPDIDGVNQCVGCSIFFCKDCDGCRVRGKRILVYGRNNEAVEYALGMLCYSEHVGIVTDGRHEQWDKFHAHWLREYKIPIHKSPIAEVRRKGGQIQSVRFAKDKQIAVDAIFTTRGDVYHNKLARLLGAKTDAEGQVMVDEQMRTSIPKVYAAGCVTPANCQMIIAAGQGATAAQSINRDLFEECLATHSLNSYGRRSQPNRTKKKG